MSEISDEYGERALERVNERLKIMTNNSPEMFIVDPNTILIDTGSIPQYVSIEARKMGDTIYGVKSIYARHLSDILIHFSSLIRTNQAMCASMGYVDQSKQKILNNLAEYINAWLDALTNIPIEERMAGYIWNSYYITLWYSQQKEDTKKHTPLGIGRWNQTGKIELH